MRILFVIRAVEHFYYFRTIVDALWERGHKVKVLFDRQNSSWDSKQLDKVVGGRFEVAWTKRSSTKRRKLLYYSRDLRSYLNYLRIADQSIFYEIRARDALFWPIRVFVSLPGMGRLLASDFVTGLLSLFEMLVPPEGDVKADICSFDPDVVVASPLNLGFSSGDCEYVKAAKKLGIKTVFPVFTWDSLTTKGLVPVKPDLVLAWNRAQVKEGVEFQKIDPETIKICGAPVFDFWFKIKTPKLSRAAFCRKYNLDKNKPILVYLGTSFSLVGDESWLVSSLRQSLDDINKLKDVQLVVRPHPYNDCFFNFHKEGVWVIPKVGVPPYKDSAIQLYFDTLYYAFATIGINTTGHIDSMIVDKPTIAYLVEKYNQKQKETMHFRYILNSGAVEVAKSKQEFIHIVKKLLANRDTLKSKRKKFVENYIRPHGISKSVGEIAALEIEKISDF